MNGIIRAESSDAGCWVDGHWGQYGAGRVVLVAAEHGWNDAEALELATRHLAAMCPSDTEGLNDEEWEQLIGHGGAANDAEAWLNENVAPAGYAFGWYDGEFYLWTDGEWENTY